MTIKLLKLAAKAASQVFFEVKSATTDNESGVGTFASEPDLILAEGVEY